MSIDGIRNLNWTPRNISMCVFVLISMVGLYRWLISPHSAYLMAAEQYETAAASLQSNRTILSSKLKRQRKQLASIQAEFDAGLTDFFSEQSAAAYLQSIQALTQQYSCRVDSLKFSPPRKVLLPGQSAELSINEYRTNLSVVGGYVNIVQLISALQSRDEKVWLESINLHLIDSYSGNLVCDIVLVIYTIQIKESS